MRGKDATEEDARIKEEVLEILLPNEWIVAVFRRCSWDFQMGYIGGDMGPAHQWERYTGIRTEEIHAAAAMLRAPPEQWQRIVDGIKFVMVPVARPILNDIAATRLNNERRRKH